MKYTHWIRLFEISYADNDIHMCTFCIIWTTEGEPQRLLSLSKIPPVPSIFENLDYDKPFVFFSYHHSFSFGGDEFLYLEDKIPPLPSIFENLNYNKSFVSFNYHHSFSFGGDEFLYLEDSFIVSACNESILINRRWTSILVV